MTGKCIMRKATLLCSTLLLGIMVAGCSKSNSPIVTARKLPRTYTQASTEQIKHANLKHQVNKYVLYSPSFNKIEKQSLFKHSNGLKKSVQSDSDTNTSDDFSTIILQSPIINSLSDSYAHSQAGLKEAKFYNSIRYTIPGKENSGYGTIADNVTPKTITIINGTNLARIHSIKYKLINVKNGSHNRKKLILKPVKVISNHVHNHKITKQIVKYDKTHPLTLQENAKIQYK